jgi:hypothetical protein
MKLTTNISLDFEILNKNETNFHHIYASNK